jgi:hypothetical protein
MASEIPPSKGQHPTPPFIKLHKFPVDVGAINAVNIQKLEMIEKLAETYKPEPIQDPKKIKDATVEQQFIAKKVTVVELPRMAAIVLQDKKFHINFRVYPGDFPVPPNANFPSPTDTGAAG